MLGGVLYQDVADDLDHKHLPLIQPSMASTTTAPPVKQGKRRLESRSYQLELFEYAKKHNVREQHVMGITLLSTHTLPTAQVVIYLDTGSGKTFVSVLLIRHEHAAAAARAQAGKGPRPLTIFMAPTVALVEQQYGVLKTQLDLRISRYCLLLVCFLCTL